MILSMVPYISNPNGGQCIEVAIHDTAAGVVFLVTPIFLMIKSIPSNRKKPWMNNTSYLRSNPILSSEESLLFNFGCGPYLPYHWHVTVGIQALSLIAFIVFYSLDSLAGAHPSTNIVSFSAEFYMLTSLFITFLIIARLGVLKEQGLKRAGGAGWRGEGEENGVVPYRNNLVGLSLTVPL